VFEGMGEPQAEYTFAYAPLVDEAWQHAVLED